VLVGVSGGADSTALLRLLVELRARQGPPFPEILVGHVHHGLRGLDADEDAGFVRDLARRHGLECVVAREDAWREAEVRRLSPEAAARAVRYRAFRTWARERQVDAILLGHHRLDQAETVLLRAVRGAGIRGLAGMAPVRSLRVEGRIVWLLRPLLDWPRAWIMSYLRSSRQPYREDRTNAERSIPRNRLRHEILPLLDSAVQPGAVDSLARLGALACRVDRDLRRLGQRAFFEACEGELRGEVRLALNRLRNWPPTVAREALSCALDGLGRERFQETETDPEPWTSRRSARVGARGWSVLLSWLEPKGPRAGRLRVPALEAHEPAAWIELRYAEIRIRLELTASPTPDGEVPLELSRSLSWGGWRLEVHEVAGSPPRESLTAPRGAWSEEVDADQVFRSGDLRVRSRRRGDRFRPLGAPGSKRLKEFFRERRVWPADRDRVPLVTAGDSIVWVVGHRIGEEFRVRDGTTRRLVLTAEPGGT
jgi:tRNA(Ile)-lysidine synthase